MMLKVDSSVGELIGEMLCQNGVEAIFGMISVHNLPIMDGIARQKKLSMVMTRGETGAAHMADGYARSSGKLGVVVSSTGPGASNTIPGLVEARFACTPLLHITGQTATLMLDQGSGAVHDMPDQLGMLRSVCKSAFRIRSSQEALPVLKQAIFEAKSAPSGPVSVEIPIDIQRSKIMRAYESHDFRVPIPIMPRVNESDLDRLAGLALKAKRPMLRVGRGGLGASKEIEELVSLGFGLTTSWGGRGVMSENHPQNLASLNGVGVPMIEKFYETVDLMIVIGSTIRNAETLDKKVKLPVNLIQIDLEPKADSRNYMAQDFICGDCSEILNGLLQRIRGKMNISLAYLEELTDLKNKARAYFRATLGAYGDFPDQLRRAIPEDTIFARDITLSNSTWGYRLFQLNAQQANIYPVSSGLGQGVQLAIGAARGAGKRKTVCLTGDGGFYFNLTELWTAIQENLNIIFIVMNDYGYGVIKHMQSAMFEGRHRYVDLLGPNLQQLAALAGIKSWKVTKAPEFEKAVSEAVAQDGPTLVEVDMKSIGPFPPYYPHSEMIAKSHKQ